MNVECGVAQLDEITTAFRFNDAVLRNLVTSVDEAVTEPSPMMQKDDDDKPRRRERSD